MSDFIRDELKKIIGPTFNPIPSRGMAHGNCQHCRATVQASAFVRAMMEPEPPAPEVQDGSQSTR